MMQAQPQPLTVPPASSVTTTANFNQQGDKNCGCMTYLISLFLPWIVCCPIDSVEPADRERASSYTTGGPHARGTVAWSGANNSAFAPLKSI